MRAPVCLSAQRVTISQTGGNSNSGFGHEDSEQSSVCPFYVPGSVSEEVSWNSKG